MEQPQPVELPRQDQWVARYVAVSFRRAGKAFAPGPAIICGDAGSAQRCAELLIGDNEIAGAVAFSRRLNLDSRQFDTAVILKMFGETPEGFDIG
jgi:hypothetical protein